MCLSKYVEIISWDKYYDILNELNEEIKIFICENILLYVDKDRGDRIFNEMRGGPLGGHRGNLKTYMKIKRNYYWENMRKDITDRIK